VAAIPRPSTSATARPTIVAVISALRTHLGYGRVAVYLGDGPQLRLEAHDGYSPAPTSVLDRSEIEGVGGPPDPRSRAAELRIPLRAASELLGALIVGNDAVQGPGAAEMPFLQTVASALAVAWRFKVPEPILIAAGALAGIIIVSFR